jgi:HSP90 family molecular chaperone
MVKRTFITSDLAENPLPKWASWIKAIIDGKANLHVLILVLLFLSTD